MGKVTQKMRQIEIKGIDYKLLGALIAKWEMTSLGWKTYGRDAQTYSDGYDVNVYDNYVSATERTHTEYTIWFRRPFCYKRGFFVWLIELLTTINQKLRGIIFWLSGPAAGLAFIFLFLGLGSEASTTIFTILLSAVFGTWGLSLVLGILARIFRAIFKCDQKTDEFMESIGLKAFSEYDDYE